MRTDSATSQQKDTGPGEPRVSVIIPTYNRANYLPETLDSLAAQTLRDHEVVLVDDGSTDGTLDLIRARPEPIRYFWQNNAGPAAARNHGLAEARGEFVGFLDSDDLWEPRFLEVMARELQEHPEIDIAFCRFVVIDDDRQVIRRRGKRPHAGRISAPLFESTFITTPSVLARRSVIREADGFNTFLQTSEDYDLWLRLSLRHRFGFVDEALCLRRSHPDTQSRNGSPAPAIRKAQLLERFYHENGEAADIPRRAAGRRLGKVFSSAGKCCRKAGKYAEARDLFRRSLDHRPQAPVVWVRYLTACILGRGHHEPLPEFLPSRD